MKKLCLTICGLLFFANQSLATVVGAFPGLHKLIEQSDAVVVVRIEPLPASTNRNVIHIVENDGWGLYECMVMRVLKGTVPEKKNLKLSLCSVSIEWPYKFTVGTTYIVFLNKDTSGYCDYRAPAIYGAVMRVSPFNHEKEPMGNTVLEKVAHVIREGRDFCKKAYDSEQRVFSTALGEPLPLLSVPLPSTPAPKR